MMVQLDIFLRISFMLSRDCDEPGTPVLAPVSAPAPCPIGQDSGASLWPHFRFSELPQGVQGLRNDSAAPSLSFLLSIGHRQLLQECKALHDLFPVTRM